jgi:hypothetical protein
MPWLPAGCALCRTRSAIKDGHCGRDARGTPSAGHGRMMTADLAPQLGVVSLLENERGRQLRRFSIALIRPSLRRAP